MGLDSNALQQSGQKTQSRVGANKGQKFKILLAAFGIPVSCFIAALDGYFGHVRRGCLGKLVIAIDGEEKSDQHGLQDMCFSCCNVGPSCDQSTGGEMFETTDKGGPRRGAGTRWAPPRCEASSGAI